MYPIDPTQNKQWLAQLLQARMQAGDSALPGDVKPNLGVRPDNFLPPLPSELKGEPVQQEIMGPPSPDKEAIKRVLKKRLSVEE